MISIFSLHTHFVHLLNYPGAKAMGSIISFVPTGKKIASNLNSGSQVIKIKRKREYLTYPSVKPLKKTAQKKAIAFEATTLYEGKKMHIFPLLN